MNNEMSCDAFPNNWEVFCRLSSVTVVCIVCTCDVTLLITPGNGALARHSNGINLPICFN